MKKIYHYTTIRTLALILKSKKIRFNRLDRVDDMEEFMYGSGPFQTRLGQYTFVSCWTTNKEENLALWNMYTRYKGVRIALDEMPFVTYNIVDGFTSLVPKAIDYGEDYVIFAHSNAAKLHTVDYIDDPQAEMDKLIQITEGGKFNVAGSRIGTFKRKEWSMQKESRFKITVYPADTPVAKEYKPSTIPNDFIDKMPESMVLNMMMNRPIATPYFDLDLDPVKLADIEILMGPLTDAADRFIVESLLKPYPNAQIEDSAFLGKLRDKNY